MSDFDPLSLQKLPIIQMVEEGSQSVISSMEEEFPTPELIYDGLLPRHPEMDTFTRPVSLSERRVLTAKRPEIIPGSDKYLLRVGSDRLVSERLEMPPDLSTLVSSMVFVSTTVQSSQNERVELNGTGILLSTSIVFTCEHLLTIGDFDTIVQITLYRTEADFLERCRGLQAKRIPLPREISGLYQGHLNCSSSQLQVRRKESLDFAVLELVEPIGHRGPFLELPTSPIKYQSGTVVCMMGLPGRPPLHPASVFSSYARKVFKTIDENPDVAMGELVRRSLFDFKVPVASFGAVTMLWDDFGNYYIPCTASMYAGMSGGPVVSLDKPEELFGIICSSFDGMGENYFIRADCPIIRSAYDWAVSSQQIRYH